MEPKSKQMNLLTALRRAKRIVIGDYSINCFKNRWFHKHLGTISPAEYSIAAVPCTEVTPDNPVHRVTGKDFEECLKKLEKIFTKSE